ncbi:MAG: serine/threonine protein kinase [Rubrivivax sp.]|nr:serine/threonine protein kinase [Rubrivivax sp.]
MNHPERLGKYQITEVIGEGAMGVVYKGFDPDIKRTVALKTIRRGMSSGGEGVTMAARFRNEAQAAGRLTHPGIVAVYDFGEDENVAFIAMEFVEGHTLAHYLASRVRFTDEDIPGVICQVLDALDHAHEQGVWHRDIKPANIIMARNGKLKVADFGIARIEDAGLTQANVMIGTPTYMAPEQFLGTRMDRRVDVYSTGVLLYLLLTGRPPFVGTQEQMLYKVVHEQPVLPRQIEGANRPHFYDAILARALAKDPNQRFATAAAFKDAIQRGVGQPIDTTVWERTLIGAADKLPAKTPAPGPASHTGAPPSGSWTNVPGGWDMMLLKQAETSLAKHVGPLASILVRRAALECTDLPTLYAKLAEQVSNPQARTAFLEHATSVTSIKANYSSSATRSAPSTRLDAPPLPEALLDAAQRLLAQHMGPIAKVVVKKAAGRTSDRAAFFALLADNLPDGTARQKLLGDLQRLT